ncbi:MAG: hypothetical protein L6R43_18425 [Planctomycetes bacterium]|nr:hypothetical protein [Planctomycetota bacterium]
MRSTFERPLPPVAIPSGFAGQSVIALPASHYLVGIRFNLSVTATGTTAVHADGLARSITFRYKYGSSPSVALPGHVLLKRDRAVFGVAGDYTEMAAGAGPATATWNGIIPRADFSKKAPLLTMDDMSGADDPTLEVQFNGAAAISPTGGAAITAISLTCSAIMIPRRAGPRSGRATPHLMMNVTRISDLQASTLDQLRRIRSGLRNSRMMLIAETATGTLAYSDALVSAVERVVNLGRRGKESWTNLKTLNRAQSALAPETGVVYFDYDPTRELRSTDLLDLRGVETMELGFDTGAFAAGCNVLVYQEEIIDPDPAAQQRIGVLR